MEKWSHTSIKIVTTCTGIHEISAVIILKLNNLVLAYIVHTNDVKGMANSEDPDQTASIGAF